MFLHFEPNKKYVALLAGLPGSGKSTIANYLKEDGLEAGYSVEICSADDFRYEEGVYTYRKSREPHIKCLDKFIQEIDKGTQIVIVDNTNCTPRSMKSYAKYATDNNYEVKIIRIQPIALEELVKRNVHGVSLEAMKRMRSLWVPEVTLEEILAS